MRDSYRIVEKGQQPHFLTLTVVGKIPIFTNSTYIDVIIENLKFYRENQGLKIYAYAVMDNHLHLISSCENDLSTVIKNFKSFTAKALIKLLKHDSREWILYLLKYYRKRYKTDSNFQFWEEGNHPKLIQGEDMFRQKVEYTHQNPVKRGLVEYPKHWLYSSARNYADIEFVLEIDELEI